MAEIPVWRFGTRWALLETQKFTVQDNTRIPYPAAPSRSDQSAELALMTLIPANLSVFLFFMIRLSSRVQQTADLVTNQDNFSVVCYLTFLISYSIYLAIYYRTIWSTYYALYEPRANDRLYFIFYSFALVLFSIGAMVFNPRMWPIYAFVLFVGLVFKKRRTRDLFGAAVHNYLKDAGASTEILNLLEAEDADANRPTVPMWMRQLVSARALTISFTRNFIVWSVIYGVIAFVTVLIVEFHEPPLMEGWLFGAHQTMSVIFIALMVAFFFFKTGGGGIRRLRNQIENGEWEGLSLLRPPWA